MVFRSGNEDFGRPLPARNREDWPQRAGREPDENSLSLSDTLRELAVTILGFVGVIVLIIAAVSYFHS